MPKTRKNKHLARRILRAFSTYHYNIPDPHAKDICQDHNIINGRDGIASYTLILSHTNLYSPDNNFIFICVTSLP